MKLTVVLGASREASFDISLNDNDFVRKWVKELSWCLDNCEFNQQESFASFLTLSESVKVLEQSCYTINRYLKDFIEIRENFAEQPQEYFNYLHSKFETLSGEFGKPTRLFTLANNELKDAIRNLNFFVHRVETRGDLSNSFYVSFDKNKYRRLPLINDDYQYFDFTFPAGTLFSHYVELGKEFIDLYEDDLSIEYNGFKNLHYYSGEAWLTLYDWDMFEDQNYLKWLQSNNIDPYNKLLGHGRIPLGTIDDVESAKSLLQQYQYLKEIKIKE